MVAVADRSNQQIFAEYGTPYEWPWPLTTLVMEARRILGLYEIPEDKRPPKAIWHSADKCSEWIKKAYDPKAEGRSNEMTFDDAERE